MHTYHITEKSPQSAFLVMRWNICRHRQHLLQNQVSKDSTVLKTIFL